MRRGFFLIIFLCIGLFYPVFSPLNASANVSAITLSLDDAIELGIDNNLNLKKNLIDLSSADYSAHRLWSEIFPTISAGMGISYSSNLFTGDGFEWNNNRATYSANLGLNLTLNAGIPYSMRNIRLAYQTRLLNYEDARKQLEIQLTKSFFGLIADRDNLTVLTDILNLAQLQYEKNQVAFRNGLIRELTLMQSRLTLENARYNLNYANSAYITRMDNFLIQLGFDHNADVKLEGKIETVRLELDADKLISENLFRRPDIIGRRHEIERLENAAKQTANANRAPSLRLATDWSGRNFNPSTDSLSGSATVSIPIDPWIPGTTRSQAVRNTHSAIEKARIDLQSTEESASAQIRTLAANIKNSWGNIEIARLSLVIAERNHELAEQGFRSGTIESLRLEDAQNDLSYAHQRLLQTELSYFNMILDVSAALNISWKELLQ